MKPLTPDDLANWDDYRKHLTEALKGLAESEPFHVSKTDFDFKVGSAAWSGRVVVFGDKADASLLLLKKAGLQFLSGTCRREGKALLVTDVGDAPLKAANKTLDKLKVACRAEVDTSAGEAAAGDAGDAKAEAAAKKLKTEVYGKLKQALAAKPDNRSDLIGLYGRAEAREKAGDAAAAAAIYRELLELLEAQKDTPAAEQGKEADREQEDAEAKASTQDAVAEAKKVKTETYAALKEALAANPGNRADLITLYGRAEAREKAGEPAAAVAIYRQLLALIESASKERKQKLAAAASLRAYKTQLAPRIRAAMASNPANRSQLEQLIKQAGEAERSGDPAAAVAHLQDLDKELRKAAASQSARPAAAGGQQPPQAAAETSADEDDEDPEPDAEGDDDEPAEPEPEASKAEAMALRQKAVLVARARVMLGEGSVPRDELAPLLRRIDQSEKAGDFAAMLEALDELEDLLEGDAEADEEAIEGIDIKNWDFYRKYLRRWLAKVSVDPDAPMPMFVSRKPLAFDMDGDNWSGRAVLVGEKARILVKKLKAEGIGFVEGSCYRVEKELSTDLPKGLQKAGGKTLKMLHLGFKFGGIEDADLLAADTGESATEAEGDTAPGAAAYQRRREQLAPRLQAALTGGLGDVSGLRTANSFAQERAEAEDWPAALKALDRLENLLSAAGSRPAGITTGLVRYRQSLLAFAQTRGTVRQQVTELHSRVAAVEDQADLADSLSEELETMFEDLARTVDDAISASEDEQEPVNAAVRSSLQEAIATVQGSPLLNHVEVSPWGIRIKGPLLQSLSQIQAAMPA